MYFKDPEQTGAPVHRDGWSREMFLPHLTVGRAESLLEEGSRALPVREALARLKNLTV